MFSLGDKLVAVLRELDGFKQIANKSLRAILTVWIRKLQEPIANIVWKKNRNLYALLFLHQLRSGRVTCPFSGPPPPGPLPNLLQQNLHKRPCISCRRPTALRTAALCKSCRLASSSIGQLTAPQDLIEADGMQQLEGLSPQSSNTLPNLGLQRGEEWQRHRVQDWKPSVLDLEAQLGSFHESLEEAKWMLGHTRPSHQDYQLRPPSCKSPDKDRSSEDMKIQTQSSSPTAQHAPQTSRASAQATTACSKQPAIAPGSMKERAHYLQNPSQGVPLNEAVPHTEKQPSALGNANTDQGQAPLFQTASTAPLSLGGSGSKGERQSDKSKPGLPAKDATEEEKDLTPTDISLSRHAASGGAQIHVSAQSAVFNVGTQQESVGQHQSMPGGIKRNPVRMTHATRSPVLPWGQPGSELRRQRYEAAKASLLALLGRPHPQPTHRVHRSPSNQFSGARSHVPPRRWLQSRPKYLEPDRNAVSTRVGQAAIAELSAQLQRQIL